MRFIYDLLSATIIVMSVTGLLVDQIKKYQYIVLLVYIMVMVELSSITGLGQIVGLVMAPVLFLILAFFIKKRKIWNLCLGCVGYLLNITFNNLVIYVVSKIGKVSALTMSEKYWLQFSVGYVVLLGIVLYIIRECLIRKRDKAIEETKDMENGYIIIVAMNTEQGCLFSIANNYKKKPELSLMQQQGYTTKGENHGMGLYWAEEMIKKHEVIHNVNITDAEVVQEIEIIKE